MKRPACPGVFLYESVCDMRMDLFSLGSWLWIIIAIVLLVRLIHVEIYSKLLDGKNEKAKGFLRQLIELNFYDKRVFYMMLPRFILKVNKYEEKRRFINFLTAVIYLLIIMCIIILYMDVNKGYPLN